MPARPQKAPLNRNKYRCGSADVPRAAAAALEQQRGRAYVCVCVCVPRVCYSCATSEPAASLAYVQP